MKPPISLSEFQARQRRGRVLEDELEQLIREPDPEPAGLDEDAAAEAAELESALQEARDFVSLPPTATREQVQAAFASGSFSSYGRFFFAHYHEDEDGREIVRSRMHDDLETAFERLVRGLTASNEESFAIPREHGKTVTITIKGVVWATSNKHRLFPVAFSDTGTLSSGFAEDIRDEVEGNVRLRAVYPEYCTWGAQPRINPHGLSRLVFGNGTLAMFAGSGKAMRGVRKGRLRPDLVLGDDIDNDAEVENPKRREKKMRWYNRVPKKLGRRAVYLNLGTILHAKSFLATRIGEDKRRIYKAVEAMPSNTELWAEWEKLFHDRSIPQQDARKQRAREFYEAHQAEMDEGAVVLWPGRFSLYDLMVERAEDFASFQSERQNDPFDPAGSYFPEDKLVWLEKDELPAVDDVLASVGFWDPSDGTTTSDTSAVPRVDALKDGRRLVSWALVDRIPPEEVVETLIGAHKLRPFLMLGVEKVGLSSFQKDLTRVSREVGIALPVQAVTPQGSKDLRIKSQRPLVVSGGLVFAADLGVEAVQQIKYYPQHPNDDLWDAIQQANKLLDELLGGVPAAGATVDPDYGAMRSERTSVYGDAAESPDLPERVSFMDRQFGWVG